MTAPSLVPLVQQVLSSPTAEPAMRRQVLVMAKQNLHQPGMVETLVASLPGLRDSETRQSVLTLISDLDTTRSSDLTGLYTVLLAALDRESERDVRSTLIMRLASGIGQDTRIAPALANRLGSPTLDDVEIEALTSAIGRMPRTDEPTALALLSAVATRDAEIQAWAIDLVCRRSELPPAVARALTGFLDPRTPADLRLSILRRLHAARQLPDDARPVLIRILDEDGDAKARLAALELLALLPADSVADAALAKATHDGDPELRARAAVVIGERGQSSNPADLVHRLAGEPDPVVRCSLLNSLRPHLRVPAVRSAVANAFGASASGRAEAETALYLELLTP
jgi:hypothetical protein